MPFLDSLRHNKLLEQENTFLKADKLRLEGEVAELKSALTTEREANTKLLLEARNIPKPKELTIEDIARSRGIPLRLAKAIDWERAGLQVAEGKQ